MMFRQLAFSILSLYLSAPCLILADENSNSGPVPNYGVDSNGASGGSGDTYSLSKGGLIAIIVVVVLVAIFGSEQFCHRTPPYVADKSM